MQVFKLSLNTLRVKVGREPSHLRVKERFNRVLKSLNTCDLKRARPAGKTKMRLQSFLETDCFLWFDANLFEQKSANVFENQ
jgi:hypothetical protein